MRIKIITTASFPVGLAASNRIMSYAKGFIKNNCNVSVICMMPLEDPKQVFNTLTSGNIDGINFYYSCGNTIRNTCFIKRRIDNFIGIIKVCFNILKERNPDKTDAIIYYSTSTSRALILYIVTRIKKILFLKEESEIPVIYLTRMYVFQRFFFKKLHYSLFDGFLLITKRLVKYFIEERMLNKPYLIVPMIVDFDRFNKIDIKHKPIKYLAYTGTLNNAKDGVDILIDAFILLAKEFPDLKLYLIGEKTSEVEYQSYIAKLTLNGITDKVVFTGRINKDAIPELICGASLLVLARPESLQAEGGFPTKLGEYLATGNPVVVTRVGEISDFLKDEVDLFMAEPGNVESLYSKMKKVLLDYEYAMEIGVNGKRTALKYFNYEVQVKNILNFITSIQNNF